MRRILIFFLVITSVSCASAPRKISTPRLVIKEYISLGAFCKKHNLQYQFDTIDDTIKIYSADASITLLLNSYAGISSGSIFYLKRTPFYYQGQILLPRQLEEMFTSQRLTSFKPVFSLDTVVIDPGHGGKDPGAISKSGFQEKDINLRVSKFLKQELEQRGFKVFLTRSNDVFLTLRQRVESARKHDADLFVSVHANANKSSRVDGLEIYYLTPSRLRCQERSLTLAKTEDFRGKNVNFYTKAILWDMLISKNYSLSVETSQIVYFTFRDLGFKIKPPKKAAYYVLRYAYVPSILFEMGYLSNYREEKILRKTYYQKQIAEAMATAISALKKQYTNNSKPGIVNLPQR